MTSRERIEAAPRHEEPDRTPVFEYVLLSPVADALLGRPYALDPGHWPGVLDAVGWERAVRQQAVDQLDLACRLGHDMMYVYPNPLPEVCACSRHIHAAGRWAVNASDGDLWSVIDDFLVGCEVDGYLEIDLFAGMELGPLKERFGDRITFYGNLDCGNMLSYGTPESIRRDTIRCLEAGQGNGGHMLCASNAITASVSVENYVAVVQGYREFFGLPGVSLP